MMRKPLLLVAALVPLIIAGCSSAPKTEQNSHGAVPKKEPVSKYGNPKSYQALGQTYHVKETSKGYSETGIASWYGKDFHAKRTSSGTPYNMHAYSAAHRTLPIPTYVQVTNLENGKSVNVRVDDRGPFAKGRIIDLSYQAAKDLGMIGKGTAKVRVVALKPYQHLNSEKAAYGHTYIPEATDVISDSHGDPLVNNDAPILPKHNANGNYTIQLNAYSSPYNASNFKEQIQQAYQLPTEVHYDGQFYRVIVHRYNTQQAADEAALALKKEGLSAKTFHIQS